MRVEHDVPFSTLTTFKVGGTVHTLVHIESKEELIDALKEETSEYLIIGGGSNILPSDGGYDGTVYRLEYCDITSAVQGSSVLVTTSAGCSWDALVKHTVEKGWWGIENLSGIPGTVGGAVYQNIGAYGAVLSQTLVSVEVLDVNERKVISIETDGCAFGYRTSIFKKDSGRYVILSATLRLNQNGQPNVSYKDLKEQFANDPSPRISAVRTAILNIRKKKFPNLESFGTAGSFFLNPVMSKGDAEQFKSKYPNIPLFPMPEGGVKVPLAWILDNVLNVKELSVGGAFVSSDQALVIVTKENATAEDVRKLAQSIQEKVLEETGITITPEVRML